MSITTPTTTTTTTPGRVNITIFGFPLSIFPQRLQYIFICFGFLITFSIQTIISKIEYTKEDISTINFFQNLFVTLFAFLLKILRSPIKQNCPYFFYFLLSSSYLVESISTLYIQTEFSFNGIVYPKLFCFFFLKFGVFKKSIITKILTLLTLTLITAITLYFFSNNFTILSFLIQGLSTIIFFKILSEIEAKYSPTTSEIILNNFAFSLLLSLPIFIIQTVSFSFRPILIAYSNSNILFVKITFLLTGLKIFGINSIINFILFELILLIIITYTLNGILL